MNSDGQFRASHLILGYTPVYTTWQPFRPALLVDSPLLSYIDVRHANFLPPQLTVGEAHDLGPRYTSSDELVPVKDASAELVSQNNRVHMPVKPEAFVQVVKLAATKSANFLGAESNPGDEMVTRRMMTIGRFVPDARPASQ